jgi:DNA-binding CsgD family transcriptional regulator
MARARKSLRALPTPNPGRRPDHAELLLRIGLMRRQLRTARSVGALLAAAADSIRLELEYDRAVILSVQDGYLHADATDSLRTAASDRLRRQVLATPVPLRPDTFEAELVRLKRPSLSRRAGAASVLAGSLDLHHYALAPLVVEARALAILVVDRAAPEVESFEVAAVCTFAELVAAELEYVVLRARQRELASDLQSLTASTQALVREMVEAPPTLPSSAGDRPAFPLTGPIGVDAIRLRRTLSQGESRIAALLVQGRSNREIADELILSPETVKSSVARILRKLGVSNRAAAAAVLMQSGVDAA